MRYSRIISDRIEVAARHFPAIVLTGARQTGKTTILRELFPNHAYVSLDLPSEAELAEVAPERFLSRHAGPVLIDEVQYAPSIFRHLKATIDRDPDVRGRFVLTGSQKFPLMQGVTESLAGRAAILELDTLCARELARGDASVVMPVSADAAIRRGFYPALHKEPDFPVVEFYSSYVATYLERDVRNLANVGDLRSFERFLRLVVARTGQLLNKAELARDANVNARTCETWLSTLEASDQVSLVEPFHANFSKRVVKSPKLYVNDVGLASFLLGLTDAELSTSPFHGALFETLVFGELRKRARASRPNTVISFHREHAGAEVDFIVDEGHALHLVECKASERPSTRDVTAMRAFEASVRAKHRRHVESKLVACSARHAFPLEDAEAVPWALSIESNWKRG